MMPTAPPRLLARLPDPRALLPLCALLLLPALGCHRDPVAPGGEGEGGGDPDELAALLEDGELVLPKQAALETPPGPVAPPPKEPPPPPPGMTGGAGGSAGSGGTGGSGGSGGSVGGSGMGGSGGSTVDGGSADVPDDRRPSSDLGTGGRGGFDAGPPICDPGFPPGRPPIPVDGGVSRDAGGVGGSGGRGGSGAGGSGMGGSGGGGGACILRPTGNWDFDDCNPFRSELRDSSFNNFVAFRTLGVQCAEGLEGQGVTLPGREDLVYVPDQPAFTFDNGVTVAAWVKPSEIGGQRTIFRKRDKGTSALALMLVDKKFVFVINRAGASAASVSTKAKAGEWVHVAATYDGQHLRLYLNGKEVNSERARGRIEGGEGPLLMGNDGNHRRFEGTLDKVWFATAAASPETITTLQCRRKPATFVGSPSSSPPQQAGTPFMFDLALSNNSSPECPADQFQVNSNGFEQGFTVEPQFSFQSVPAGQTVHIPVTITSPLDAEEGSFAFPFSAFSFRPNAPAEFLQTTVNYVVAPGTGCQVSSRKSLMIRDVSVVDDPVRTGFTAPADDPRRGAWTFKTLLEAIAGGPSEAAQMAEDVFTSMTRDQVINTFTVSGRRGVQGLLLDPWPRKNGQLDLEQAPLRLLAIVNRIDVRLLEKGHAGEGRFVFGMLGGGPGGFPLQGTVILEYHLPAKTEADVLDWAKAWHHLSSLPFPSEEYNAALQAVTTRFAGKGAFPGRPNDSALAQLRTNEIDLGAGAEWELREFTLNAQGKLLPDTIKLTPHRPTFDRTPTLAEFVNENEMAILAEKHDVPLQFKGQPFLSGAVFNPLDSWSAPGIRNPEARHKFALNTCNGCHSAQETNTIFLMIGPRVPGQESFLSQFLTGTVVFDPVTGPRTLNDLARRNRDMRFLVCPDEPIPQPQPMPVPMPMPVPPPRPVPPPMSGAPDAGAPGAVAVPRAAGAPTMAPVDPDPPRSISKGIGRVH